MKKLIIILTVTLFGLTGCTKDKNNDIEKIEDKPTLEDKLIDYGKDMYKNYIKGYLVYTDGEYTQSVTLDQLNSLDYDISEFETDNCNILDTKVDITMTYNSEGEIKGDIIYTPFLSCN